MAIQGKQLADLAISTAKIADNAVTSGKVDSSVIVAGGGNPLTSDWAVGNKKITGLKDPDNDQDVANKRYVDASVQGLDVKQSCRLATAAALPANTRTGNILTASVSGSINVVGIDGKTDIALNQRVLVKNEGTGANNGLYFVSDVGSPTTPWTLTRTTDADTSAKVTSGVYTYVEEGSANQTCGYILSTPNPITLNSTSLTFTLFSKAGIVTAGAGLQMSGSTINLVIEATSGGLTANTDDLQVNYALGTDLAATDAGAADAGNGQKIPRANHKHQVSTAAPSVGISGGTTADSGSATTMLRSDARFGVTLGTPVNVGTSNTAGSAANLVGANHVHAVPVVTPSNKNMTASVTVADGDQATATTVVSANALGGRIAVTVNGVRYSVGNGTKVGVCCYFSGDGGTTARAFSAVAAGDTLRWNGSVAGFQLAATDAIDVDMDTF
jgi:hypothetical protein